MFLHLTRIDEHGEKYGLSINADAIEWFTVNEGPEGGTLLSIVSSENLAGVIESYESIVNLLNNKTH